MLIISVLILGGIVAYSNPKLKYDRQLTLGQKYLNEMDYQKAVAAYQAAIEIDSKSPDAYEALAEVYIAIDDLDSAKKILSEGVANTKSEELSELLSDIQKSYKMADDKDDSKSDFDEDADRVIDSEEQDDVDFELTQQQIKLFEDMTRYMWEGFYSIPAYSTAPWSEEHKSEYHWESSDLNNLATYIILSEFFVNYKDYANAEDGDNEWQVKMPYKGTLSWAESLWGVSEHDADALISDDVHDGYFVAGLGDWGVEWPFMEDINVSVEDNGERIVVNGKAGIGQIYPEEAYYYYDFSMRYRRNLNSSFEGYTFESMDLEYIGDETVSGKNELNDDIETVLDAYVGYFEEECDIDSGTMDRTSVYFIYLNDDLIPEMIIDYGSAADGADIFTYSDGMVDSIHLRRGEFSYWEKKNVIDNSAGNMGYYTTDIISISDGKFIILGSGIQSVKDEYYDDDSWVDHVDEAYIRDCDWDGREVSYTEYEAIVKGFHPDDTTTYNASYELGVALSYDTKSSLEEAYHVLQHRWGE